MRQQSRSVFVGLLRGGLQREARGRAWATQEGQQAQVTRSCSPSCRPPTRQGCQACATSTPGAMQECMLLSARVERRMHRWVGRMQEKPGGKAGLGAKSPERLSSRCISRCTSLTGLGRRGGTDECSHATAAPQAPLPQSGAGAGSTQAAGHPARQGERGEEGLPACMMPLLGGSIVNAPVQV